MASTKLTPKQEKFAQEEYWASFKRLRNEQDKKQHIKEKRIREMYKRDVIKKCDEAGINLSEEEKTSIKESDDYLKKLSPEDLLKTMLGVYQSEV